MIILTLLLQEPTPDADTGSVIGAIIVGSLLIGIYFLPAIVGRKKHNADSIALLNLLLGWTFIGWVVALVWATTKEPAPKTRLVVAPATAAPSVADELTKLQALRAADALTEEEFAQQKQRVLNQFTQSSATEESQSPNSIASSDYQAQKQRLLDKR